MQIRTFPLVLLSLSVTLLVQAQTAAPPASLFGRPTATVRQIVEPRLEDATTPPVYAILEITAAAERQIDTYWEHSGQPILIAPPPAPSDNRIVKAMDQALSLDVIRVKNVKITGSVVTAIHRKNPLKLLHPLVFAVAW